MKKSLLVFMALLATGAPSVCGASTQAVALPTLTQLAPATQQKLRAILARPELANGFIGVEIRALGKAKSADDFAIAPYSSGLHPVLFAQNATRRFLPASNMKLFTAALALSALGGEKTFTTQSMSTQPPQEGVVAGDIQLVGGGDPALSSADVEDLARQIAARGVKRITGDVVGIHGTNAETFGGRYPDGWTLDDALWYYGPEVSSLAINRNQIDVTLSAPSTQGEPIRLDISPAPPSYFRIVSRATMEVSTQAANGSSGENGGLLFDRADDENALGNTLFISGNLRAGESQSEGVAVPNPPRWAAEILREALLKNGVQVDGVARSQRNLSTQQSLPILAAHDSPPVAFLLRRFLKNSDNLYGEMLLRNAAIFSDKPALSTQNNAARGHELLRRFLRENNIAGSDLRFTDGSGLSRYNLLTPRATTQLLAAIAARKDGAAIWDALPIAGVDGTLKKRMLSTQAKGNVRAKTGTFSIASALSGYVTTRRGDRLAVSVFTNFCDGKAARTAQDDIFSALAQSD